MICRNWNNKVMILI
uniref:Uncharacterized protein n=1 Tax=Rhizophora mucronata TaxID=61149 RepID=A0A2P2NIM8_RHIMU